jgi:hypothetical protein
MGWGGADLKYRFQWTFPIVISPHDAGTLFVGGNVVFKSTNDGHSWEPISPDLTRNDKTKQGPSGGPITHDNTGVEYYCTIFSLAESPLEQGVIWTGSDDGLVHLTRDGGKSWRDVTPLDAPKWSMVSMIDPSPHDSGACYLAVNAYKSDDFAPYVFKTADYGATWTKIVSGIGDDAFVRSVREDPGRRGLLYLATETGVHVSFNDGDRWQPLQLNLPVVPVTDLAVKDNDLVAATQGRSFWILDNLNLLRQLNADVAKADVFLFSPAPIHYGVDRSAAIYYHLSEKPDGEIKLEFLDAKGEVIDTFTNEEKKEEDEPSSPFRRRFSAGSDTAPAEAGLNKFDWNTRYKDATEVKGAVMWAGSTRGPASPPGTYHVKLTIGQDSWTTELDIAKDPRSESSDEDYAGRFAFLLEVRDKLTAAHDAINLIRQIKQQANAAADHVCGVKENEAVAEAAKSLAEKLTAVEEELIQTKSKSFQDPLNYPVKLNNKIATLSFAVSGPNFAPTRQARDVLDDLAAQLDKHRAALDEIVKTDVPAFNKLIAQQNVPAIAVKEDADKN